MSSVKTDQRSTRMRMGELSERTGVPVATLKYYLREGLLHPGRALSKTQADYDDSHLERVRLVRALSEVGGLPLSAVRRVLEAISSPDVDRLGVLEAAQRALPGIRREGERGVADDSRAARWVTAHGWQVHPGDPTIADLDRAWDACEAVGLGLDEERMDAYAASVEEIAEVDVATVPQDREGAVRQVVLGTVLVDPVLMALRRLAHQHLSVSRAARQG